MGTFPPADARIGLVPELMTVIGGEFAQAVQIQNPGQPAPVDGRADVWQSGPGEFDLEGTLQSTWTAIFPPGTLIEPLAEVVVDGRLLWVSGMPEARASLLSGFADHIEATLKSIFRLETVVDVLRDADRVDSNDLGDGVETEPTAHLTGITAAITETSTKVPTADGELRTTRILVGWLPAGTDVKRGDRIRDAVGRVYGVESVTQPLTTGLLDLRLDLTRYTTESSA